MFIESEATSAPLESSLARPSASGYLPLLESLRRGATVDASRALDLLLQVRVKKRDGGSSDLLRTLLAIPERLYDEAGKKGLGIPELVVLLQAVCRGEASAFEGSALPDDVVSSTTGSPDSPFLSKALDVDLADLHLLVTGAYFDNLASLTSLPPKSLPRHDSILRVWVSLADEKSAPQPGVLNASMVGPMATLPAPQAVLSNSSLTRAHT